MFFKNRSLLTRSRLLFIIMVIIGLLFFIHPIRDALKKAGDKLVLAVQMAKLKAINSQMQNNYRILQSLLLAKVWEEKFSMYQDKEITRYLGPGGINERLLQEARLIGKRYNIGVKAQFTLLCYSYREKNGDVVVGFIGLDCAGLDIVRANMLNS